MSSLGTVLNLHNIIQNQQVLHWKCLKTNAHCCLP